MACKYSFDGGNTYISEEKFIEELANGKLEEFINDKVIDRSKLRGGKKPPVEPPISVKEGENENEVSLKHAATEEKRAELGMEGRTLREVKTDEKLENEANEEIQNGYNVKRLTNKILNDNHLPTDTEHMILVKYAAGLESKLEKLNPSSKEFEDTFNELNKVYKASEIGGSELGAAFRARQSRVLKQDTLGEMLVHEAEINQVDELTVEQREKVTKEYEEIKKAKEEWENKYNELVEAQNKKDAEIELNKAKSQSSKPKKAKDDYKKERDVLKESIKDKWKKASQDGTLMAIPVPYAKQLAAISPDVAKLMKSYVEEGITNLSDVVKNIHEDLKDYINDITEKDVRDIIAGVYNEKRTKNEILESLRDLRDEAKLLKKLEDIENGEIPKNPKLKIERNKKITELRKKIKDLTREDITLKTIKTRIANQITELENKLLKGDYSKEEKKEPIKLDKEALELKDKLIKLKQERELRLAKEEYENKTKYEKAKLNALELLNVPRTAMASADLSAPLRQGIVPTISHPIIASKAFVEMLRQAISQKRYDRWLYDIKESSFYEKMEKSGLYIADTHTVKLDAKEEMFMNNLAEKVPLIGKVIKGSERAYTSYLNKMRVDLFIKGMEAFEADGKTVKNNPKLYKDLASFINNATGRGEMNKILEDSAPLLNAAFFSPRLMASRLNLLNPLYYYKLSPEIKTMAMKDMGSFLSFGITIIALAALNGYDVEKDPRSPNFGKIKSGDYTYDIWGGFQQWMVEMSQILRGSTKSASTGEIRELSGEEYPYKTRLDDVGSFLRGKLAPVPAAFINVLSGKKTTGERTNLKKEALSLLTPLVAKDFYEGFSKDGIVGGFAVTPAVFGIGVQRLSVLPENVDKNKPEWKFVYDKKLRIPKPDLEKIKVGIDERKMTEKEIEEFDKKRLEKIGNNIKKLIDKGLNVIENNKIVLKKVSELNSEQLNDEIESYSRKATQSTKDEMFGKVEKTLKEKRLESLVEKRNRRLN